jgi:hypothetical protein
MGASLDGGASLGGWAKGALLGVGGLGMPSLVGHAGDGGRRPGWPC